MRAVAHLPLIWLVLTSSIARTNLVAALVSSSNMPPSSAATDMSLAADLAIVGGGVVGLAVLRAATCAGYSCVLVERGEDLLEQASGSNSGILCTGVDAAIGSLERALIRDSMAQFPTYLRDMNLPNRPCGSLVCQWPWDDENEGLVEVLEESHMAGDTHATRLDGVQVLQLEQGLNSGCQGAIHIPGEIVVDPWMTAISLAVHARQNGAKILTGFEVDPASSTWDGSQWTLTRKVSSEDTSETFPKSVKVRAVVSATGLWADDFQETMLKEPAAWQARPRRGQYCVFAPSSGGGKTVLHHPIQPIPTPRTKGIFVFSTIYDQVVVGPTALDQLSKTDREADSEVAAQLAALGQRIIPGLDLGSIVGEYVGIRPGSDKRDYQIRVNFAKSWIACASIRSTGLTASLGIGRHVLHLLQQGILHEPEPLEIVQTRPLPPVQDLVVSYNQRGDGKVLIDKHLYRVTHPLTRWGWESRTGLACGSRNI